MRKGWAAAIGLAVLGATPASAEEQESPLNCQRFADGRMVLDVYSYPAFIPMDTYIYNDSDTETFIVTSIWDWPGSSAPSSLSIDVPPGTSIGGTTFFRLESYAQCASLAGRPERAETGLPIRLKTFTEVRTSTGEKVKCVARVVCH